MGSLAAEQRGLDAEIFDDIGEVLIVGSVEISGVFVKRWREIGFTDGTFVGVEVSFDCQMTADIAALEREDLVSIVARDDDGTELDLGEYRFLRRLPRSGDESGLVILELAYP